MTQKTAKDHLELACVELEATIKTARDAGEMTSWLAPKMERALHELSQIELPAHDDRAWLVATMYELREALANAVHTARKPTPDARAVLDTTLEAVQRLAAWNDRLFEYLGDKRKHLDRPTLRLVVAGPSGCGKSTIAGEFVKLAARNGYDLTVDEVQSGDGDNVVGKLIGHLDAVLSCGTDEFLGEALYREALMTAGGDHLDRLREMSEKT